MSWLTAPGAKFTWSGVKRVEFKADGSVSTPWGEGTWGVLAGEAGEGQVWADFVGAHHVLSRQARDAEVVTSIRCSDGDLVLVRRIGDNRRSLRA